jgi:hypothetical protein
MDSTQRDKYKYLKILNSLLSFIRKDMRSKFRSCYAGHNGYRWIDLGE